MAVVIDFSSLTYRMMFGSKNAVIENPDYLAHLIMTATYKNIREFKISTDNPLVWAVDSSKSGLWRKEYYESKVHEFPEYAEKGWKTYKDGRKHDPTMPWDDIRRIMSEIVDMAKSYTDIIVLQHPQAEADDCIKVACDYFDAKGQEVDIVASDRDFVQLLSENIRLYDPIQKRGYIPADPDYLVQHILKGDTGDAILGCKRGIGPKTAIKMSHNLKAYLDTDRELKKRYEFNEHLIDLNHIPKAIYRDILEQLVESQPKYNMSETMKVFMKYKLRKAVDDVGLLKFREIEKEYVSLY